MDISFTDREMRFVLAEMVKSSKVDVEILAGFIRAHQIEPDWMNMQLPFGRNLNQCMQAAERMAIHSTSLKRRSSNDHDDTLPKRAAAADEHGHLIHPPQQTSYHQVPPNVATHLSVLPRSAARVQDVYQPMAKHDPPKKRGRPSRVERTKRDLQPLLPRPLAPQPPAVPQLPQASPGNARPTSQAGMLTLAPKPTAVPALLASTATAARPITPPEAHDRSKGASSSPRGHRRGIASSPGDGTRPLSQGDGGSGARSPRSPSRRVLFER